ncbi:MAG: DinB family protein [Chitinophagales bacterium]
MVTKWNHPAENEYPSYYGKYIAKVPDTDLVDFLKERTKSFVAFLEALPEEKLSYRYAENKWTIPQIVQHLIDAERIFTYRALRFARNDKTNLPGFEENDYANEATGEGRTFAEIINEFNAVRNATITFLDSMNDNLLSRTGTANNNSISVRSICYIMAGHTEHHWQVIIERYLNEMANMQ